MSNKIEQQKAKGSGPLPKGHGKTIAQLKAAVDSGTPAKKG